MATPGVVPVTEGELAALGREFLDAALIQLHPKMRAWRGDAAEAEVRPALDETLRTLVDDETARELADAMHLLDLPAACFKSRLIEIGGVRLIAAINFRDTSGAFPFVRILRATVAPGTIADWTTLKPVLLQAFDAFEPRSINLFHPSHLPLAAPTTGIEDHLLVAPAQVMAALPSPAGLERVALWPCTSLDFYPRYKAIYDAVYVERAALAGEVRTESEESLAGCRDQGLLFEIIADGVWAGVLAADRRTIAGVTGVYMVEIVLAQDWRGQRLGAAVHHRFATAIAETEPAALILGTISAKNAWSLAAARRAGRIDIGAWHWVER